MAPLEHRRFGLHVDDITGCSPRKQQLKHTELLSDSKSVRNSPVSTAASSRDHPVLGNELIGGGNKGLVQKGFDMIRGTDVAIKRVEPDNACPIRFLEVTDEDGRAFFAEGFVPLRSRTIMRAGPLAYDAFNEFGTARFEPERVQGRIVLVRRGGGASFADKVLNAKSGGAVGVLIINNSDTAEVYSLGDMLEPLPSLMLTKSDGEFMIKMVMVSMEACDRDGLRVPHVEVRTDAEHEVCVCNRLLPHPQVVEVFDAWMDRDTAVVVMEHCEGGRVSTPGTPEEALGLIKQLLAGLAHLHSSGICHRDVKLENMMLTHRSDNAKARAVLLDFSMASTSSKMVVQCGSLRYLAPEVISGTYSFGRDVWSAGIVAYELVYGVHPFAHMKDKEVLEYLANPVPVRLPESIAANGVRVSPPVIELLRGLLEKDPSRRLSALEALAHPALSEVSLVNERAAAGLRHQTPFAALIGG